MRNELLLQSRILILVGPTHREGEDKPRKKAISPSIRSLHRCLCLAVKFLDTLGCSRDHGSLLRSSRRIDGLTGSRVAERVDAASSKIVDAAINSAY